jgi:hypothetical protein
LHARRHRQRVAGTEHGVQGRAADLLAHGAQRRLLQHLVAIAGTEQVQLGIADAVLDVDLDEHDVLVGGQDRHVVAEGLDLGGVELGHALDRPRRLEVRAGLQNARELAEAQHHAALLLGHQHEAVEGQPQGEGDADPAQGAVAAATAAESAEQATQRVQQRIEPAAAASTRGTAIAAGIVTARGVPGHACS